MKDHANKDWLAPIKADIGWYSWISAIAAVSLMFMVLGWIEG